MKVKVIVNRNFAEFNDSLQSKCKPKNCALKYQYCPDPRKPKLLPTAWSNK